MGYDSDFRQNFTQMLEHFLGYVQAGTMTKAVALSLVGNLVDYDKVPTTPMEIEVYQWVDNLSYYD